MTKKKFIVEYTNNDIIDKIEGLNKSLSKINISVAELAKHNKAQNGRIGILERGRIKILVISISILLFILGWLLRITSSL